jgi:hypothetical protein
MFIKASFVTSRAPGCGSHIIDRWKDTVGPIVDEIGPIVPGSAGRHRPPPRAAAALVAAALVPARSTGHPQRCSLSRSLGADA